MKKINVIYIAGEGRSGSTLLERMLGQHSKIFAAGEQKHIWERSFIENQLCSCNEPFYNCPFWEQVIKHTSFSKKDAEKQIIAQQNVSRLRHFFKLKKKRKANLYENDPNIKKIIEAHYILYKSILETSESTYIIDASKHPVFAFILSMHPNINLHVIHLIRDLRGVAYSWTKKKVRPEITTHKELMPRYSVFRTALSWMVVNSIASQLKEYASSYTVLRYEDMVSDPKRYMTQISKHLNLPDESDQFFLSENTVSLKENHTVSGNPMRFKTGKIVLQPDEEWKEKIKNLDLQICNLIGKKSLLDYNYV